MSSCNIDNSYVDKMYCWYCTGCRRKICNSNSCDKCGKSLFSPNDKNVYTQTIPPRVGYSYYHHPSKNPFVWYYGSWFNKLITRY